MLLDGRTVVIGGATGELGSTMARECFAAGANLLLLSNNGIRKELLDGLSLYWAGHPKLSICLISLRQKRG
jgi:NAD(P)-dependent dehydrogenase (short-subunit alcohol dehydrogenase family)